MSRFIVFVVWMGATSGCTKESEPISEPLSINPVESFSRQCSYTNLANSGSYTGQCLETFFDDSHREIVGGGLKFSFPAQERKQGQWTYTKLNGKNAVRYEVNRYVYAYATEDLQELLDVAAK